MIEASNSPSLTNCPISTEDIANARVIYGQCKDCAEGKPYPLKGRNETLERQDITAPGQLIHIDIVYVGGIPFLFSVDDFSGYMHMIRMTNKSAVSLQGALLELILYYRGHLKVVQTISADHESTILACESYVNSHGAALRSRIPGEHEVDAERGMRTVRESMRVKILELEADYKVPNAFLPWLAMDCTNTRNFIPNTRSSPRMPEEIVKGAKVNFRTDITASFGQLVLVKTNNVSSDGVPVTKQEYAIALGRVIGTTGAVWVYRMDAARVVSRRVIKAVPMTEEWRQHLNDLAKQKPIDSAKFFEFKSALAYGPEDHEDVERVTVQPSDRSSVIQPQSVQPDSKPPAEIVQPVQAPSPGPTSVSTASPRIPVSPIMSQRASPYPATSPSSPVNPRQVSFGPAPASPAPDQPVAASPAPCTSHRRQ